MDNLVKSLDYFKGKSVLVTGHTGFKGGWMCRVLTHLGAKVIGYALEPPTNPSLFEISGIDKNITSIIGDVRDYDALHTAFETTKPEAVFHLAAQPLVRESYKLPVYTYETNVMGTVNLFECIRNCESVKTVVNVTTDKVYENKEWAWGYREYEPLNGYDPYSNSKSCSELVTSSYIKSFLTEKGIVVSTARAGNVIGGGDFALDRIIPDCVRAMKEQRAIVVRNPYSTRPYQHVLEPVLGYLMLGTQQLKNSELADCYNVGPDDADCVSTGTLVDLFCDIWGSDAKWEDHYEGGPHEAGFLKLDCSKLKRAMGWRPVWGIRTAVEKTVEWTKRYLDSEDMKQCMDRQIEQYLCDCRDTAEH